MEIKLNQKTRAEKRAFINGYILACHQIAISENKEPRKVARAYRKFAEGLLRYEDDIQIKTMEKVSELSGSEAGAVDAGGTDDGSGPLRSGSGV